MLSAFIDCLSVEDSFCVVVVVVGMVVRRAARER